MQDFWDGVRPLLDAVGAEPWMYGTLVAFGIAHQFAAGAFSWWTRGFSFVSSVIFAAVFGGLSCGEHSLSPLACGGRVLTLLAASLLAEAAANRLVGIVPGIPKYREKE